MIVSGDFRLHNILVDVMIDKLTWPDRVLLGAVVLCFDLGQEDASGRLKLTQGMPENALSAFNEYYGRRSEQLCKAWSTRDDHWELEKTAITGRRGASEELQTRTQSILQLTDSATIS